MRRAGSIGADRTQRARNTRLVIKQSANSGLFPVCSEEYSATAHYRRPDHAGNGGVGAGLMGVFGDEGGWPDSGHRATSGPTTPVGKAVRALELSVLLTLAALAPAATRCGARRLRPAGTTRSLRCCRPAWLDKVEGIEGDLVQNDAHAKVFTFGN